MNYVSAWMHIFLYRFIKPLAYIMEWALPPKYNRGKRAVISLSDAGIVTPVSYKIFSRGYYISLWRSYKLLKFCQLAPVSMVRTFLSSIALDTKRLRELADSKRAVIIASPHYGAFIPACLKIIQEMHGKKKVHVFYNDPENTPSNRVYADIFKRVGYDVEVLFVGRKGTLAALRALRRNECVLIMPDVVLDESATIVVPFMNRLLRVMPGCAFFALHSNAIIASVFCEPLNAFGVDMSFADTIDSGEFVLEDKDQNIFLMTKALFAQFEDKFLSRPYHWNYWDRLAYYSSGLDNFDLNSIAGYDDVIEKRARLIRSFDAAQTV